MKDNQGREISLSRLDMLTDEEVDQLKGDSWDDYCWKSGNQYVRMVHEFCVIEQDKRIRAAEDKRIRMKAETAKMDALVRRHEMEHKFWTTERMPKPKKSEFGPSGERLPKTVLYVGPVSTRGILRELKTGTE